MIGAPTHPRVSNVTRLRSQPAAGITVNDLMARQLIENGSKALLRAHWRHHPDRMGWLYQRGRAVKP